MVVAVLSGVVEIQIYHLGTFIIILIKSVCYEIYRNFT